MNDLDKSKTVPERNIENETKKKSVTFPYLKIGEGKLASDYHGETEFAKQRKEKIIKEQKEREAKGEN